MKRGMELATLPYRVMVQDGTSLTKYSFTFVLNMGFNFPFIFDLTKFSCYLISNPCHNGCLKHFRGRICAGSVVKQHFAAVDNKQV